MNHITVTLTVKDKDRGSKGLRSATYKVSDKDPLPLSEMLKTVTVLVADYYIGRSTLDTAELYAELEKFVDWTETLTITENADGH